MAKVVRVEKRLPDTWEDALRDFLNLKRAQGVSETTEKDYQKHVRHFFKRGLHQQIAGIQYVSHLYCKKNAYLLVESTNFPLKLVLIFVILLNNGIGLKKMNVI